MTKTVVTFASWEYRFREGMVRNLGSFEANRIVAFHLGPPFSDWSRDNRICIKDLARASGVEYIEVPLEQSDAAGNWREVSRAFTENGVFGNEVLLDITTMPREFIWLCLWFLEFLKLAPQIVYHRPGSYAEWLSREPREPRLVYKLSGITSIGCSTALVVLAGYDKERIKQLISWYEPEVILLGLHDGLHSDQQNDERMNALERDVGEGTAVDTFPVDTFKCELAFEAIENAVAPYLQSHNIVASSLGPKTGAVALYCLHRRYAKVALSYAPSRDYNKDYSSGIGEKVTIGCWLGSLPCRVPSGPHSTHI